MKTISDRPDPPEGEDPKECHLVRKEIEHKRRIPDRKERHDHGKSPAKQEQLPVLEFEEELHVVF
jgi:hypothetical protein